MVLAALAVAGVPVEAGAVVAVVAPVVVVVVGAVAAAGVAAEAAVLAAVGAVVVVVAPAAVVAAGHGERQRRPKAASLNSFQTKGIKP